MEIHVYEFAVSLCQSMVYYHANLCYYWNYFQKMIYNYVLQLHCTDKYLWHLGCPEEQLFSTPINLTVKPPFNEYVFCHLKHIFQVSQSFCIAFGLNFVIQNNPQDPAKYHGTLRVNSVGKLNLFLKKFCLWFSIRKLQTDWFFNLHSR